MRRAAIISLAVFSATPAAAQLSALGGSVADTPAPASTRFLSSLPRGGLFAAIRDRRMTGRAVTIAPTAATSTAIAVLANPLPVLLDIQPLAGHRGFAMAADLLAGPRGGTISGGDALGVGLTRIVPMPKGLPMSVFASLDYNRVDTPSRLNPLSPYVLTNDNGDTGLAISAGAALATAIRSGMVISGTLAAVGDHVHGVGDRADLGLARQALTSISGSGPLRWHAEIGAAVTRAMPDGSRLRLRTVTSSYGTSALLSFTRPY